MSRSPLSLLLGGLIFAGVLTGCQRPEEASRPPGGGRPGADADAPVTVDVAIARLGSADGAREYTGTTQPARIVSTKARVDGQVFDLVVDAGDEVVAGQVLARIDDRLLRAEVEEAEAELGARLTEIEEVRFELAETRARVAEAEILRERARADALRFDRLAAEGAVPQQQAEIEGANFDTAEQAVIAIEEQVRSRERAIATAQQRADAQVAIVQRVRERLSFATVVSPLDGVVLDRVIESGDVVRVGDSLLELGDFSQVQVRIEIADRDRQRVELGQPVTVELDAFPGRQFEGRVARIFPIADPVARLIPVEITLADPRRAVGGGLLARVGLEARSSSQRVAIPSSALEVSATGEPVVFVLGGNGLEGEAIARRVTLAESGRGVTASGSASGSESNPTADSTTVADRTADASRDTVEILSGLVPGDAYIVRSAQPLEDGQRVRRSFLSDS
ncbi:MAG: efflux RND transporter periplasmic adaptor subunit [Geitlerinemataceae cyanobacterium]